MEERACFLTSPLSCRQQFSPNWSINTQVGAESESKLEGRERERRERGIYFMNLISFIHPPCPLPKLY
jgi:hypothetical protein